jgi:hypothetical protein
MRSRPNDRRAARLMGWLSFAPEAVRNPDPVAEQYRARIAAGETLGAFHQRLFERALEREAEAEKAAAPKAPARFSKMPPREAPEEREAKALQHAGTFVRLLEKHKGPRGRVWNRGTDVRVYFAGDLGYVSVSPEGAVSPTTRGRFHFVESDFYPAWRKAYRAAQADMIAEREKRIQAEWAAREAEGAKENGRARPNAGLSKREKMMVEAGVISAPPEGYIKPGTFGPFVPMVGKYKYKVKMNAEQDYLDLALYEGTRRVGTIQLSPIEKMRRVSPRCIPLIEGLNPPVGEYESIRGWYVSWSEVQVEWRGEGLGRLLYDAAIDAMFKARGGWRGEPGPFVFMPGDCSTIGSTSKEARRVWPSLARDWPHKMYTSQTILGKPVQVFVIRVDHPPVFRMPKAARKAESAAANPQHARRMRRNPSDLERAWAGDKNLIEADLSEADLSEADLYGANLTNANLSGANLTYAGLLNANLTNANLSGANLSGANLTDAGLLNANLTNANLYGANLTGANLTGVDLTKALNVDEAIGIVEITRAVLPVQGRSSAFDKWFGKSKIVNEDGTPKVLYHGTNQAGFTAFSKEKIDAWHPGFFLADKPELAQTYSGSPQLDPFATGHNTGLYRVYVRMAKPYIHDAKGSVWNSIPWQGGLAKTDDIGVWAKAKKYDGVIIRNVIDIGKYGGFNEPATVYIVFDPTNIKSAAYNRGTWDRKDPDIRHNPNGQPRTPRAPRRSARATRTSR